VAARRESAYFSRERRPNIPAQNKGSERNLICICLPEIASACTPIPYKDSSGFALRMTKY